MLSSIFVLISVIQSTDAQYGGSGSPYYTIHLDKVEYVPRDTVTIKVEGIVAGFMTPLNNEVSITISEFRKDMENTKVIYQDKKTPVNGWSEFKYKIPESPEDSPYRYLVQVYQSDSPNPYDKAIFFSKKDASKIVISDLIFDAVDSNGNLHFSYKVADIFGNPIPGLESYPSLMYQSCDPARNGLPVDISSNFPKGIISGTLTILEDFQPGTYSLYIYAQGPTNVGFQYTTNEAKVQYLGKTEGMQVIFSKVIPLSLEPPKSPIISSTLNAGNHTLIVTSDNRICDYQYLEKENRLVIHVSSTEIPQFMKMTIPKEVFSKNIAISINGYHPKFDIIDNVNNYDLSFNYTGCSLDIEQTCQINIFEINNNNKSSTSKYDCVNIVNAEMHRRGSLLDQEKAISLASQNDDFIIKTRGYNATFNSIFHQWSWDNNCNLTLQDVNVAYSLYNNKGYVKNLIVTLDPGLTKVISTSEQQGGFYSGQEEIMQTLGVDSIPLEKENNETRIDYEPCCDFTIPIIAIISSFVVSIVIYLKIGKK